MSTTTTWVSSGTPRNGSWGDLYGWRSDPTDGTYQGDWGYGHYKGLWYFNDASIRSTLSGQRILSVSIEIQRRNTSHGSTAAGTPTMRLHNYSSQPSGEPTMGAGRGNHGVSFARGDKKWVPLYTSWGEALRDGTARGIGLYTTSDSPYLIFEGVATLSITYEPLLQAPATPTGFLITTSTSTSVSMVCDTVADATTYRFDREGGGTAGLSNPSFDNGGLSPGTVDRWRVRAENDAGVSAYTPWRTGQTNPPTPTGLSQSSATTSSIGMSWNPATNADSYTVEASGEAGPIAVDLTSTSFTDTGLLAGTAYDFRVSAYVDGYYNDGGFSDPSAWVTMYTLCSAPAAPSFVNVTATAADISWGSVAGATSYKVYRSTGAGAASLVREQSGTAWQDTGLAESTTYDYYIVATNSAGDSANGTTASVTTASLPDAPSISSVTPTTGNESYSLTVSWNTVSDAEFYVLQRLSELDVFLESFIVETTSFDDVGLSPGESYNYRVRAENAYGASNWSAIVPGSPTPVAQQAPSPTEHDNYDAALASNFRWTFNTGNANDGQTEYDFEIYDASSSGASTWSGLSSSWSLLESTWSFSGTGSAAVYSTSSVTSIRAVSVPSATLANDASYMWRVRTKDSFSSSFGPWSEYSYFDTATPPVVTITSPVSGETFDGDVSSINISWTYSQSANAPQESFRVTAGDFDSGWILSTATNYEIDKPSGVSTDITVQTTANGVESNIDSVTVNLSSDTQVMSGDSDNVRWSSTAGYEGGPAFIIEPDALGGDGIYNIFPTTNGWSRKATYTDGETETWESRKTVDYPTGTNIVLTVIKSGEYTFELFGGSKFGLRFEYVDGTEESSFMMDVFESSPTISVDLDGNFRRYVTSMHASKDVSAIRLVSEVQVNSSEMTENIIFDTIDVSRSGLILSKEYLDTDSLRGLLLTGSGYIQGTELRVQNSSGLDEGIVLLDDVISTSGDLTIAPGGILDVNANVDASRFVSAYNGASNDVVYGLGGRTDYGMYGGSSFTALSAGGFKLVAYDTYVRVATDLDVDNNLDVTGTIVSDTSITSETFLLATGNGRLYGTGGIAGRSYSVLQTNGTSNTQIVVYGDGDSSFPGRIALRPAGSGTIRLEGAVNVGGVSTNTGRIKANAGIDLDNASSTANTLKVGSSGNYISTFENWLVAYTYGGSGSVGFRVRNPSGIGDLMQIIHDGGQRFFNPTKDFQFASIVFEPMDTKTGNPYLGRSVTDRRWDRLYAINATDTSSDARLKEDVQDTPLGLDFVRSLRPVDFLRTGGSRRHQGLIAQEVKVTLEEHGYDPALFSAYKDPTQVDDDESEGAEYLSLAYEEFLAPTMRAVQELADSVDELSARVAALEA